jgi:hypothetical protein
MENLLATTIDISKKAFDSLKRILKTLKVSKNILEVLNLKETKAVINGLLKDAIDFKCQIIAQELMTTLYEID